ncbi:MAG: tetratricopeptide repeat protein [Deltaproteobacteria bacterium]|nr:tetratricopeptide repeat protein [Deltaproteobacteria bacterium]
MTEQEGDSDFSDKIKIFGGVLTGRFAPLIVVAFLSFLAFVIYSNTFSSPFQLDDIRAIVDNDKIRDLSNFLLPDGARYVGDLSFAINYGISKLDLFGFHLVNILIHIINGFFVWWLTVLIFRTPALKSYNMRPEVGILIAFSGAVLFIAHPLQTQAVTYIVQRYASLATLFYLLAMILYVKARLGASNRRSVFLLALAVISAVCAMKTKEISFTLPFVLILYELVFFGRSLGDIKRRLFFILPMLATALIIPVSLIDTNTPLNEMLGEFREAAQETESISRSEYLITQSRVLMTYIRLIFLPVNQNLDYHYPIFGSIFVPEVFASLVFLLSLFILAFYLAFRFKGQVAGLITIFGFGVIYFFLTISVESSVIPIRDVIFEHRVYMPGIGIFIALSSLFCFVLLRSGVVSDITKAAAITAIVACVLAVPLGISTYKRNLVWKDSITLWEDVVYKSMDKPRAHYNLGVAYSKSANLDDAMKAYDIAIKLDPDYGHAYFNMANLLLKIGRVDEAILRYERAVNLLPGLPRVYNNLGNAYMSVNDFSKAMEFYNKALLVDPRYAIALNNLGFIYKSMGDEDRAISYFRSAIASDPDYAEAHNSLGSVYGARGQFEKAKDEYEQVLKLDPAHISARYNLALSYLYTGQYDRAHFELVTILSINPGHQKARNLLTLVNRAKKEGKKIKVE